jgi:hypothetical protein
MPKVRGFEKSSAGAAEIGRPPNQRVFARATAAIGFRELSASPGGFLLLLFFARQRKVKKIKGLAKKRVYSSPRKASPEPAWLLPLLLPSFKDITLFFAISRRDPGQCSPRFFLQKKISRAETPRRREKTFKYLFL